MNVYVNITVPPNSSSVAQNLRIFIKIAKTYCIRQCS